MLLWPKFEHRVPVQRDIPHHKTILWVLGSYLRFAGGGFTPNLRLFSLTVGKDRVVH